MKPLLTREDYLSEAILQAERKQIFHRQWQFAGVSLSLPNHHDYFLVNIAGKEVIVQNFDGQLSAFTNVCSHRYSAIHTCEKGNRPLQCPYHRWAYDAEGLPKGIPDRKSFPELRDGIVKLEDLRLERWQLSLCGTLIFIRLASDGADLQAFLGDQFDRLARISSAFEREIHNASSTYEANWKLVLQNTVEAYHVPSVHPQTFGRLEQTPLQQVPATPPHLNYVSLPLDIPFGIGPRDALRRRMRAIFAKSQLGIYENQDAVLNELVLIWPCTTIGHTNGKAFAVFTHTPLTPTRTILRISQWLPKLHDASDEESALRDRYVPLLTSFLDQVAGEDRDACESVQRGISNASALSRGLIGEQEGMVHQFQMSYVSIMRAGRD